MTTRVISVDLRTGTRIAELEVSGLKYGQRLNSAGTLTGTVALPQIVDDATSAEAATINDAVDECRRHLIIERDGVIVGDGIVWASPYTDGSSSREITASSTWSYFWHRRITHRSSFGHDQLIIAQSIMTSALGKSGGDIGVTIGSETSGVIRTRTYEAWEYKEVGEAIEQLAAVENGFDFAIDCSWDNNTGALIKRFNLHYPRRGRTFSQTGHVFELGRNVTDFTWPSDGSNVANTVYGIGDGEGSSMLRTSAVDASQIQAVTSGGPGYPLLEDVLSNKDVKVRTTLQEQTNARLAARSKPVVIPKLTVRADLDPVLGSYMTGDACRIIIPPGMTPRFPLGLDTFRRIVGWDVTVDEQGTESVELMLGEEN